VGWNARRLTVASCHAGPVRAAACAELVALDVVQCSNRPGHLRAFAAEFGLSPVAQRRLRRITPPDDDEHSPFTGG
jgi:hypothetical protein